MLSFPTPSIYQSPKCFFTLGKMGHIDPKQPPSKGKPWTTLSALDFVHSVDLIIPESCCQQVLDQVASKSQEAEFKRVIMSLGAILDGDFFAEYIKKGNIMMRSEGRLGVDDVFTLKDGKLTLYLHRETYERSGLVGRADGGKADRGLKLRWKVELDLRSPAMIPGKKGFDRLRYACNNVLNRKVTWLFCNLCASAPQPDPLDAFFPLKFTMTPGVDRGETHNVPPLTAQSLTSLSGGASDEVREFVTDLYEWISLVRLQSPRVYASDQIDPYLSRYQVPGKSDQQKLCKISWQGFIASSWARQHLIGIILALPARSWFSYTASTFSTGIIGDNSQVSIFRPPSSPGEYMMWDIRGHE